MALGSLPFVPLAIALAGSLIPSLLGPDGVIGITPTVVGRELRGIGASVLITWQSEIGPVMAACMFLWWARRQSQVRASLEPGSFAKLGRIENISKVLDYAVSLRLG
jgi:hypothetical protein